MAVAGRGCPAPPPIWATALGGPTPAALPYRLPHRSQKLDDAAVAREEACGLWQAHAKWRRMLDE
jgi:hypothetical protein